MTRTWLIFALVGLASAAGAASGFNGTWVRDAAASDPVGGRIGGEGRPVDLVTLTIEDRDGAFQVTRRVSMGRGGGAPELVQRFPLNGKEVTNPSPAPGGRRGEVRSQARLDGARVLVEGVQQIAVGIELKTTDTYELSVDGKTLTITTTRSNRMGTQTGRQVYRRQ